MPDPPAGLEHALSDRYTIDREIGRGGMATVYLARDLRHGRNVAVKVLSPDVAASVGAQRFLREIKVAAGLRHPHILPLYDSGEADGSLFYVMPYEEERSLRARLRKEGPLPVEDAVRILRDVADALAYAHSQGVVHRDIKPDNVLLSGRHATVTDFGVAKALSESVESSYVTTTGVSVGTPAYMSPEQATADPTLDHRADVYAFGVLAYELLVGEPPFTGSYQAIIAGHVTQVPADVSELRPEVPPKLSALIRRCLEKRPDDRWQRLDDVLSQLESLSTPSAGVPPFSGRSWLRKPGPKAIAATLVIVTATVGWWLSRAPHAAETARVAVAPLENRTGVDSLNTVGAIAAEMITNGLTRAGLADVAPTQTVLAASVVGTAQGSATANAAIVQETQATLLVSGTYSLRGDSIAFEAQLVDASQNRVVAPVEPIVVPKGEEARGIQQLGERVAVVLSAQLKSPLSDVVAVSDMPMSMDAYQEYMAGVESLLRVGVGSGAIRHLRRAVALDSTAAQPYLWLSLSMWGAGVSPSTADSILAHVASRRGSLPPFDQAGYDWLHALYEGRNEEALLAARKLVDMGWGIPGAMAATYVNRLDEALADIESDAKKPSRRKSLFTWFWYTQILHRRGEFEQELKAVREAESELGNPAVTLGWEAQALASLGRVADLRECLESIRAVDPGNGAFLNDALVLLMYGWTDAAHDLGGTVIQWYRDAVASQPTLVHRLRLAESLFYFGDATEARAMFQEIARDSSVTIQVPLAYLGLDAARRGDQQAADSIIERFETRPMDEDQKRWWQADIAARLGDCPRAVDFLRRGLKAGLAYPVDDQELMRLQGCPEYDRFMAPKG